MEISISEEIYERLATHAVGFESPEMVVKKLLDAYESRHVLTKPILDFYPNEEDFKKLLIKEKRAWRIIEFTNDKLSFEEWQASNFHEGSNLRSNIWSGVLRDWQNKNIRKVILTTQKPVEIQMKETISCHNEITIKVGAFIKEHLQNVVQYCNDNEQHINLLKTSSEKIFGIPFDFIMLSHEVKEKGLNERYWKKEYSIDYRNYRFCSQFGGSANVGTKSRSEYHGDKFIGYLKTYDLLLPKYKNIKIRFVVG